MQDIISRLPFDGNKTYLTGAAMIVYAIGGFLIGYIDANASVEFILTGIGFIAGRHAIEKKLPPQ